MFEIDTVTDEVEILPFSSHWSCVSGKKSQ